MTVNSTSLGGNYNYTTVMEHKYVIEFKMLSIISATNLNDLQTHIFLFRVLISVFKEHSVDLLQYKI